ncbi:Xaa-Pro peptidase family protein [Streptomyces sp. DSM 42041]|uniref:Xaa-Pro peptidase family protein n=1 Tax=Streptomyces hazeniae TaxID=3075538 RepID=A0ABU2NVS9_9ACTN|nr:Xaa-Pro peptidase family protein [Streptomyces sp. DSM 42041]MDT0381089.1 Xaa-Pro peptidase family protein [Streptomyces sp. DSM 42041]
MRTQIIDAIRQRLQARGLDAYVAYTPSNVFYVTGFQSFFLMEWWRMLGTVVAVVPADPAQPPALVVSDFEAVQAREVSGFDDVRSFRVWVELRDAADLAGSAPASAAPETRPAQYDTAEQDAVLRSVLADRGLLDGRIGTDLRYVLHDTVRRVAGFAPALSWADMTEDLYALRSVKYDFEIDRLRRATELSEAGMTHAVTDLRPGLTALDMRHRYQQGVLAAAMADTRYADYTDQWVLPAVGSSTKIGVDSESGGGLAEGDLIKFDCGTTVGGYRGDGGRTFAYRTIRPETRRLYDVLLDAHEKARAVIRPGTPVREVFRTAEQHIRAGGYPSFTRGHYGHSVGIDTFHEEPPYLGSDEGRPLEAGMVLAVETPAYSSDTGAIMIEDLVLVTRDGHEVLHRLPHELTVVG